MKIKSGLFGLTAAAVMLCSSTALAAESPYGFLSTASYDVAHMVASTASPALVVPAEHDTQTDGVIGASSVGIVLAMATDNGSDSDPVLCRAACKHKIIDNVVAATGVPVEVGWQS